jgi:hypothetical protein
MTRTNSLGVALAVALILIATSAVLVTRALETSEPANQQAANEDENEGPPTADELAHAGDRLAANGFEVSDEVLTELATQYGVGGAVRIVAWSEADPARMADLRAMRDGDGSEGSGMGWGQIAKELGVHPGIGSIMGKGGDHESSDASGEDR